jgi:hypothetical protein
MAFAIPVASASASTSAPSSSNPCQDTTPPGIQFYRCTGTSESSSWVGLDCNIETNYNASNADSPFNVYAAYNNCPFRIWLHQYVNWDNNGWSYCINPGYLTDVPIITAPYDHPLNIYMSDNPNNC